MCRVHIIRYNSGEEIKTYAIKDTLKYVTIFSGTHNKKTYTCSMYTPHSVTRNEHL